MSKDALFLSLHDDVTLVQIDELLPSEKRDTARTLFDATSFVCLLGANISPPEPLNCPIICLLYTSDAADE